MPKMNPEIKAKWVAALRDPSRKQTKDLLRDSTGMCCLGVLCDVMDPAGGEAPGLHSTNWKHGDDGNDALPGVKFCRLIGFQPAHEKLGIGGSAAVPQDHNDYRGATFAEIADAIEEQW